MRTALLRGRDHLDLGGIEAVGEGRAALALSAGGAPKAYPHTDRNEDGACLARGAGGSLAAVADAHNGCEASQLALERLLAQHAAAWTAAGPEPDPARWHETALAALLDLHYAVLRGTADSAHPESRSTVGLALLRPAQGRCFFAALGDSHVFRAGLEGAAELAAACEPRFFLGSATLTPAELREHAVAGHLPASGLRALVLATDGLSERGLGVDDPAAAVGRVAAAAARARARRRPLQAARGIVEEALAAHRRHAAGDNVAAAVLWLEEPG